MTVFANKLQPLILLVLVLVICSSQNDCLQPNIKNINGENDNILLSKPGTSENDQLLNQIKIMNDKFIKIYQKLGSSYAHDQQIYKQAEQIIQYIKNMTNIDLSQVDEVVIPIGKTGSGKSTSASHLDGVKLIGTQNGLLKAANSTQLKTLIGTGYESTTLLPVLFNTKFGYFYDLPGQQQTRGVVPEIINGLIKRNILKLVKRVKLLIVVPNSVFTSQGSYGSQFKTILKSADSLLGNLNNYKNSIVILVTFAKRYKNEYKRVIKNIQNCIQHQNGELKQFQQLIKFVMQQNRIKLIAQPDQNQIDYTTPSFQQWNEHQNDKIVESIKNTSSYLIQSDKLSVPHNLQLIQKITSFIRIYEQKAKKLFEQNFNSAIISGVQLTIYKDLLKDMRNSKYLSLGDFYTKFTKYGYYKVEKITEIDKKINFLYQFIGDTGKQSQYKTDWISDKLDQKISNLLQKIEQINSINTLNFRKQIKIQDKLSLQYKSLASSQIQQNFQTLQNHENTLHQLSQQQKNQNSQFYDTVSQKVYQKTVYQPYQVQQNYVQIEKQQKIYRVQRQIEENVPVQRQRTAYRNQIQYYTVAQPRVRRVPKVNENVQQHCSGRRYGFFGPRNCRRVVRRTQTFVDQVYHQNVQHQRTKSVPYIQYYQSTQKRKRIIDLDEARIEDVPVQKTRMITRQKQVPIYIDVNKQVFNKQRYQAKIAQISQQIQNTLHRINQLIINGNQQMIKKYGQPLYSALNIDSCGLQIVIPNYRSQIQRKYSKYIEKWVKLQIQAVLLDYSNKNSSNLNVINELTNGQMKFVVD